MKPDKPAAALRAAWRQLKESAHLLCSYPKLEYLWPGHLLTTQIGSIQFVDTRFGRNVGCLQYRAKTTTLGSRALSWGTTTRYTWIRSATLEQTCLYRAGRRGRKNLGAVRRLSLGDVGAAKCPVRRDAKDTSKQQVNEEEEGARERGKRTADARGGG